MTRSATSKGKTAFTWSSRENNNESGWPPNVIEVPASSVGKGRSVAACPPLTGSVERRSPKIEMIVPGPSGSLTKLPECTTPPWFTFGMGAALGATTTAWVRLPLMPDKSVAVMVAPPMDSSVTEGTFQVPVHRPPPEGPNARLGELISLKSTMTDPCSIRAPQSSITSTSIVAGQEAGIGAVPPSSRNTGATAEAVQPFLARPTLCKDAVSPGTTAKATFTEAVDPSPNSKRTEPR